MSDIRTRAKLHRTLTWQIYLEKQNEDSNLSRRLK